MKTFKTVICLVLAVMMDRGRTVMDRSGEEKKKTSVQDVLQMFNQISIECGN